MTADALCCRDERRRRLARTTQFNGLDYVDVGDDPRLLRVYFLGKAPEGLTEQSFRIEGGRRITGIQVLEVRAVRSPDRELDDCVELLVDRAGDSSKYDLRFLGHPSGAPKAHEGAHRFDPRYTHVGFWFTAGSRSDLDCRADVSCPPRPRTEPEIDYLARDYASFRQLLLDRLTLIMPAWRERHVPDLGIALVEVLAYVADHLSYHQDAVATEAYLGTARRRISVRRHTRLVDYRLHEGCNARTWLVLTADDADIGLADLVFTTDADGESGTASRPELDVEALLSSGTTCFEPVVPDKASRRTIYRDHSEIHFYTWGNERCCLEVGATHATLVDGDPAPPPQHHGDKAGADPVQGPGTYQRPHQHEDCLDARRRLHLAVGDFLLFEEVVGPTTGNPADADRSHRHVVRLTRVESGCDPVTQQPILEIDWCEADALPFALCLSTGGPPPECGVLLNVSVARGNVVLVDHGLTICEQLTPLPADTGALVCRCGGPAELTPAVGDGFDPVVARANLTFAGRVSPASCATGMLRQDPRECHPQIRLFECPRRRMGDDRREVHDHWRDPTRCCPHPTEEWYPVADLLASEGDDPSFVVEMDDDRRAHLRFGDGRLGRRPAGGARFNARYRVGNGVAGNVGAESIVQAVFRPGAQVESSLRVRNPLPAVGGTTPEPIEQAKLLAPSAFRTTLARAITAGDYARLAEAHPGVQRAAAVISWIDGWYEVDVAIDAKGTAEPGQALLDEVAQSLAPYRRIGHHVAVVAARYVPLRLDLSVGVLPHLVQADVRAALLAVLGNGRLPDGRLGLFHPDNLTFGDGVYLSRIIAAAQAVEGVASVTVEHLSRQGEPEAGERDTGVLPLGPLEVARLDNDPDFPEHGVLALRLGGGR
jgi:hypothetical protein